MHAFGGEGQQRPCRTKGRYRAPIRRSTPRNDGPAIETAPRVCLAIARLYCLFPPIFKSEGAIIDFENFKALLEAFGPWSVWGAFAIVFCVFGMPNLPGIITAIGKIVNDRHRAKLAHERSMRKIENQIALPPPPPKPRNGHQK